MMQRYILLFLYIPFLLAGAGCVKDKGEGHGRFTQQEANERLVGANRVRLKMEHKKIDEYIERRNWLMNETESGLRYYVYEHSGEEIKPDSGQVAVINYEIRLMDGAYCYCSDSSGSKGFTVGKGEIEKGIDEGILFMNKGDKAKFILPSHLGYGLMGDAVKIPSHAVLVYDVELVDIR